jgi:hypothetical protein
MPDHQVRVVLPKPDYTLFDAKREGLPEVIVVNGALIDFPHKEVFPWYLRISINATELIENGMPSTKESELLFEIGDEIEEAVLGGITEHGGENALFLGRSTWNALRELRYQVHTPEIAHNALQNLVKAKDWPRPWEYEMKHQPDWEIAGFLFQLFPPAARGDA